MSYGFLAENDNGEVVIDDTLPIYALVNETSVSGTTSTDHSYYEYDPCAGSTPLFYELPVGSFLLVGEGGKIVSDQSSLNVREAQDISTQTSLGGYGMEVYDASGNLVFSSGYDMVPIDDKYVGSQDFDAGTQTNITASGDWVHISSAKLFEVVEFRSGVPNVFRLLAAGLFRNSTTEYETTTGTIKSFDTAAGAFGLTGTLEVPTIISL